MESVDAEGYPVPACQCHPEREPFAACVHCGQTVCKECATLTADGYLCPTCLAAAGDRRDVAEAEVAPGEAAGRRARVCSLVGLVPVVGAPAALAGIALAITALRRRRDTEIGRGAALSLGLGAAGLLITVAAVALFILYR